MKFFHISDLHIGLKLMNRDLREDQEHVLAQVAALARREGPDAVVIAGDIYDKAVPSAEAVEVFDSFITALREAAPASAIMAISGNHDSAARVNVFRGILGRQGIHMIGLPPRRSAEHIEKVTLADAFGPVHFYLLPFVRPSMVRGVWEDDGETALSYDEAVRRLLAREEIDADARNVLVSHQFYLPVGGDAAAVPRMDSEIVTVGNIDMVGTDVLRPFDYAALGHIHKPMRMGDDCYRYSGTPLACSVSEAGQQKAVLMVELAAKGETKVTPLPLAPLRQVRVLKGKLAEVLAAPSDDFVSVVLTDTEELDAIDMQDRLRHAFPHLLEVRREGVRQADYASSGGQVEKLRPMELMESFLGGLDAAERALMEDVVHAVQEAES